MLAQAQPLYEKILISTVGSLGPVELTRFSGSLAKLEAAVDLLERPSP